MNLISAYSSQDESGSENSVEPPPKKLEPEVQKPQLLNKTNNEEPKTVTQTQKKVENQPIQTNSIASLLGKRKRNQIF